MKYVNSIVICRSEYSSKEEFQDAIKDAIMVLLNNNYIMTVRYDEKGLGIISIEYNHANKEHGADYPYWLSPSEVESVIWDDEKNEEDDYD